MGPLLFDEPAVVRCVAIDIDRPHAAARLRQEEGRGLPPLLLGSRRIVSRQGLRHEKQLHADEGEHRRHSPANCAKLVEGRHRQVKSRQKDDQIARRQYRYVPRDGESRADHEEGQDRSDAPRRGAARIGAEARHRRERASNRRGAENPRGAA